MPAPMPELMPAPTPKPMLTPKSDPKPATSAKWMPAPTLGEKDSSICLFACSLCHLLGAHSFTCLFACSLAELMPVPMPKPMPAPTPKPVPTPEPDLKLTTKSAMTAELMPAPTQGETDSSRFINLLACLVGHLLSCSFTCYPAHLFACPLNILLVCLLHQRTHLPRFST